jgi:cytochrome c-type biogenesis protein CcmF
MLVELGRNCLLLAVPFAAFAMVASAFGSLRDRPEWVKSGERASYAVFALLCLSMIGCEYALLTDRFDLSFVAMNSSREQPWPFKMALWGGQAGSLLLWAWMLAGFGAIAVFNCRNRNRTLVPWVVVSLMGNVMFFLVMLNWFSNPFEPADRLLSNGRGMNPLLQHPVMLIHPPILYTGFVGFAVPFSFAFAALVTGELGTNWFRTTRRWTLLAWFFLGTGLMLGGRWAYEVLGWGGYWAWDPVENSSLMPWLVGTAYVHSVMIQEKRGMLKIWNLALIGLTYTLCLFGTFLTRSGIVESVHAFADSEVGEAFAAYVIVVAVVFTAALIYRVPELRSPTKLDSIASREASFLMNNYVFLGLLAIVFWGTMYPVFTQLFIDEKHTFGPPFFQAYAGPLAIFLLILTGVGPLIAWRRATLTNLRKSFLWPVAFAVSVGAVLPFFGWTTFYPWSFLTLCAFVTGTIFEEYYRAIRVRMKHGENAFQAFAELVRRNQRRYAGYIVHLAVVIMFIGFAGAAFDIEETKLMRPGERWTLDGYTLEYRGVQPVNHPHFAGAKARIALYRGDTPITMLEPEKRMYFQQQQATTFPAISSGMRKDVYVNLNGLQPDQSVALKVYINPLVNWVWIGGLVFVIGNTLLLWRAPERQSTREN